MWTGTVNKIQCVVQCVTRYKNVKKLLTTTRDLNYLKQKVNDFILKKVKGHQIKQIGFYLLIIKKNFNSKIKSNINRTDSIAHSSGVQLFVCERSVFCSVFK